MESKRTNVSAAFVRTGDTIVHPETSDPSVVREVEYFPGIWGRTIYLRFEGHPTLKCSPGTVFEVVSEK